MRNGSGCSSHTAREETNGVIKSVLDTITAALDTWFEQLKYLHYKLLFLFLFPVGY